MISIIVSGIVIAVFLLFFNLSTEKAVEQLLHNSMWEMNRTAVIALNNQLGGFTDLLEQQAKLFGMLDQPTDREIMTALTEFAGEDRFKNTAIITFEGRVYSSVRGIVAVKEDETQPNLKKSGTVIGQPRIFYDGTQVMDISTPVYIDHRLVGRLVASIDSNTIAKMFSSHLLQGEAALCLIAKDGTLISRISDRVSPLQIGSNVYEFYESEVDFVQGSTQQLIADVHEKRSSWLKYRYTDQTVCLYYEPVGINNWVMTISATDSYLQAQAGYLKKRALLMTIGILAVVAAASVIIIRQRVKEQKRIDTLKNTYSFAIRKTNDLFYEADIDSDVLVDHSENGEKAPWKETPRHYSNALLQVAEICAPECRQQFLDTFLPQNIKIKIKEGISSINFEYKINPDENTVRWLSATFVPIVDAYANTTRLICMENDITERKLKQESLKRSAVIDGLTGLFNKTSTKAYINSFLAGEGKQGKHACVIIDIDRFKSVNDQLGHTKGDEVLSEFGGALKKIFRKSDIIGRIGGDEFVILIKDYAVIELIISKMEEVGGIIRKDHALIDDPGKTVRTSASMGIALYSEDGSTFDELYKSADSALYISKERGRDCATFYRETVKTEEPPDGSVPPGNP